MSGTRKIQSAAQGGYAPAKKQMIVCLVHSDGVRWWVRLTWVVIGFVVPSIVIYKIYVATQPVHHDLSDIGTGLFGLVFGVIAGLVGAAVALVATRRRPR